MKIFIRFFLLVSLFTALIYFILKTLKEYYQFPLFLGIDKICLFHFSLSLCVLSVIYTVFSFLKKYTAFAFLGTALIRMGAVIIFVFPLVKKSTETPVADTLFVVIPYFVFTVIEAVFTVKLIQLGTQNPKS